MLCSAALLVAYATLNFGFEGRADPCQQVAHARIPALFVENKGQWDPEVLFGARAGNVALTVLADGFVVRNVPAIRAAATADGKPEVLAIDEFVLRFADGARATSAVGLEPGATRFHYLVAPRFAAGACGYSSVLLEGMWPGLGVRLRFDSVGRIAWDLEVDAGGDARQFAFEFDANEIQIDAKGRLAWKGPHGQLVQTIGACYRLDGTAASITAQFDHKLLDEGQIGFDVDAAPHEATYVIDPTLEYLSYFGSSGLDPLETFAVDSDGGTLLGTYTSSGYIGTPGALQQNPNGMQDIVLAKFASGMTALEWLTYLGGEDLEIPYDTFFTSSGILLVGRSWSTAYPTTEGVLQPVKSAWSDFVFTEIAPDGSAIHWSTFYGGNGFEEPDGVGLFDNEDLLLAGRVTSTDIQVSLDAFDSVHDSTDRLIARIASDGSQVLGSTWFSGRNITCATVAADQGVLVAGVAEFDTMLPVTDGVFDSVPPPREPFGKAKSWAAKFDASGTQLLWCTYLGPQFISTLVHDIECDAAGAVYLTHQDAFNCFTTPEAFMPTSAVSNGYLQKLLPQATGLAWATYLGSQINGVHYLDGIEVDPAGNLIALGRTSVSGWPVTPDAFQKTFNGPTPGGDLTLGHLNCVGEDLLYSTYLGGTGGDSQPLLECSSEGVAHLCFQTYSTNLPSTPGVVGPTKPGGTSQDLAVAAFDLGVEPWRLLGYGTQGSRETPNLVGLGDLLPGTPTRLALRGAEANMPVWFVAGFSESYLPLLGGTLVPAPQVIVKAQSNGMGWCDLQFNWPVNVPSGSVLTIQTFCLDVLAPHYVGISNALRALAQ